MRSDLTCPVCELTAWRVATETDDLVGRGGDPADGYHRARAWYLLSRRHGEGEHDRAMAEAMAAKRAREEKAT
jgi:hypothetical protein